MDSVFKKSTFLLASSCLALSACSEAQDTTTSAQAAQMPELAAISDRLPEDEIIYFMLPDRFENGNPENDTGGIEGGPLEHGFDPTHKGFYNGGDFQGVLDRLDYIQGLGITAIWLTPIFENKAVQGEAPYISAGYHGYWITDFYNVDPHLGSVDEFRAFVDAAHERGMKVYMDIITNHTADVIALRECHDPDWTGEQVDDGCAYRSIGDYPWTTRGGPDGEPINEGFLGNEPDLLTEDNFARLTDPNWAYTPFIPTEGEEDIKNPAWLNDPIYYNNRGETRWEGENSVYGDFAGLDDIMTEHPRVVDGMIEIYQQWITDYRVDGFRVDTTKHVNIEFWPQFSEAIIDHAHSLGIGHFTVFAEVYEPDPGQLARFTTEGGIPSVLDFAFQSAALKYLTGEESARIMERFIYEDQAYAGGQEMALTHPTFLGNHDMGRVGRFLSVAFPEASDDELLQRNILSHALMMFSRGVPTIYYGDEQGMTGDGNDQDARETLFPSQVEVYNDNNMIGTDETPADDNFDTDHPLYEAISEMAAARIKYPALRRGRHVTRHSDLEGGLYVFSRLSDDSGEEILIAINNDTQARDFNARMDGRSNDWTSVMGGCASQSAATGSYPVSVGPLDFIVCRSVREM